VKKIKVVLVDDHSMVRAGIKDFLSRSDLISVVGEAKDGIEAQQIIKSKAPDVVLVDIQMPNLGGIELTAWIHQSYPDMKIMILSSHDDDEYIMESIRAGANGYSLKNTSPAKLIDSITEIAANKAALDPSIAIKVMNLAKHDTSEKENFTPRELQILQLLASGNTNKEIGTTLFISSRTVQGHLSKVFTKLDVETRTEAAIKAIKIGLVKESTHHKCL
jgi:DNA-binding NarL/FixJ family response regulator